MIDCKLSLVILLKQQFTIKLSDAATHTTLCLFKFVFVPHEERKPPLRDQKNKLNLQIKNVSSQSLKSHPLIIRWKKRKTNALSVPLIFAALHYSQASKKINNKPTELMNIFGQYGPYVPLCPPFHSFGFISILMWIVNAFACDFTLMLLNNYYSLSFF